MIVDDNETDRFVHRKLLELYKISENIMDFDGAMPALDYLRENINDLEKLPEIILLDIMMPIVDGFGFLAHYEGIHEEIAYKPTIFMLSSTDDDDDIRKVRNNNYVKKLLRKPFSPESFKKAISKL